MSAAAPPGCRPQVTSEPRCAIASTRPGAGRPAATDHRLDRCRMRGRTHFVRWRASLSVFVFVFECPACIEVAPTRHGFEEMGLIDTDAAEMWLLVQHVPDRSRPTAGPSA